MDLKGKTILITGASEGLGKAIAENLAKENTNLVIIARNKNNLKEISSKLNALAIPCDVTKPKEVKEAVKKAVEKYENIDVVINCAGIWLKLQKLEEIPDEDIANSIEVNLKGVITVTKHSLPYLKKRDEAYIINISSHSGVHAKHLQSVYCGTKFGVRGFTEALKLELKDHNIKVVGFYPSGMATKMFEKAGESFDASNFMKTEDMANIINFILKQPSNICMEEVWIDKFSGKKND